MAKTMLKLVKSLPEMIDEYGALSERKRLIEKEQELIKHQIDAQINLGDAEVVTESGEIYQADKFYPMKKRIAVEKFHAIDPDTFWRVASVTMKDATAVLTADVLHEVTEIEVGLVPQLTISKKKI